MGKTGPVRRGRDRLLHPRGTRQRAHAQKPSERLGYSACQTTRRFRQITGWTLREYLRRRRLAFALRDVRDGDDRLLDIALCYGFSSHAAFIRAFRSAFGVSPAEFRSNPGPVVLRTKLNPFDRYFFGLGEIGMV